MVFSGKTLMPISWYQVRVKAQNSTYHGMSLHELGTIKAEGVRGRMKKK
jgi:hypothetical protein